MANTVTRDDLVKMIEKLDDSGQDYICLTCGEPSKGSYCWCDRDD